MENLVAISLVAVAGIWGVYRIVRRMRAVPRDSACRSDCRASGCPIAPGPAADQRCADPAQRGAPPQPADHDA